MGAESRGIALITHVADGDLLVREAQKDFGFKVSEVVHAGSKAGTNHDDVIALVDGELCGRGLELEGNRLRIDRGNHARRKSGFLILLRDRLLFGSWFGLRFRRWGRSWCGIRGERLGELRGSEQKIGWLQAHLISFEAVGRRVVGTRDFDIRFCRNLEAEPPECGIGNETTKVLVGQIGRGSHRGGENLVLLAIGVGELPNPGNGLHGVILVAFDRR